MKIKICGNTQNYNIEGVAGLEPDYMGFIFYNGSPRDVSDTIQLLNLLLIPSSIERVAVFVNEDLEKLTQICTKYNFSTVQLHGDESPEYCEKLRNKFKVIKAFRVSNLFPNMVDNYQSCCDYYLFDTAGKTYGGTGEAFNHKVVLDNHIDKPFFLSGGISPNDAKYLRTIQQPNFHGIDINSKFETSPGIKNLSSLNQFINNIRS